ncbi:Elongator complex protein 4, partial [Polychytrium aggregatum]|uniref:Elongator complex protein 4 n=1 Tax=Polychytrium aggregatum TaxID=110093 RepID=UPI0022FE803E
ARLPLATKVSAHNGQVLLSTGCPSLDDVLGGGLPIGSVILIKEDRYTGYSDILLKYFLAQGIVARHPIFLATADENGTETFRKGLMGVSEGKGGEDDAVLTSRDGEIKNAPSLQASDGDSKLKIAWRYQGQAPPSAGTPRSPASSPSAAPQPSPSGRLPDPPYCATFDLTRKMSPQLLGDMHNQMTMLDVGLWANDDVTSKYDRLLNNIQDLIESGGFRPTAPPPPSGIRDALRIGVHSIGSPMWGMEDCTMTSQAMFRFFHRLRGLVRFSFSTAFVTIPAHLYNDYHGVTSNPVIRRIEHMCDAVIEIESFAGSPKTINTAYTSDYHGFIHAIRLPRLNSLSHSTRFPESQVRSLAFKVRRKRFLIEPFHLPPEAGDSAERESKSKGTDLPKNQTSSVARSVSRNIVPSTGCAAGLDMKAKQLDF